jgi:anthranilate/para-aminobenzoate synthase component I
VNLARRFGFAVPEASPGAGLLLDLYARAAGGAPPRFGAVLALPDVGVVSLSPELLLRAEAHGGRLVHVSSTPIKGTRPRGDDEESDRALAAELDADPKERAELAMIIDVVRHDVGCVCRAGTVTVAAPPRVVSHPTVHHREATVTGVVRDGASRATVLESVVPSGSVTGAPKVRAMEVIAELEPHRRGLYTGGIGHVTRDGSVVLAMAIRTLVVAGARGSYFTGGGIVADSDPERELLETEWKAARLFRALGIGS